MTTPVILITAGHKTPTAPYERAVTSAGGQALVRLPGGSADVPDSVAGLIIAGGASVEPARYGADIEPGVTPTMDVDRDDLEWTVLGSALERGLPILGICRGLQVINVFYGGELHQELALTPYGSVHKPDAERTHRAHAVRATGGRLAAILGTAELQVNSIHRQGVKALAPGLLDTVHADDGLVEGVETPDGQVLAVQWHPEELIDDDAPSRALFEDLVARSTVRTRGKSDEIGAMS